MPVKLHHAAGAGPPQPRVIAVRASAGAGKTYQLTLRFLELMHRAAGMAGGRPTPQALRQIIAITFTNRAAAEMKDRIILALKEIALGTDDGEKLGAKTGLRPDDAAAWLDVIPEHFGDFQVRTIDSLIYTVMRAFAVEMGLPPELDVDFERATTLDRCFDSLLASVAWENPKDPGRQLILSLIEAYLNIDEKGGVLVERAIRGYTRDLYDLAADARVERGRPDHERALGVFETESRGLLTAMGKSGFLECAKRVDIIEGCLAAPRDHLGSTFWDKASLSECLKKHADFGGSALADLEERFATTLAAREAYFDNHSRARIYPYLAVLDELRKQVRVTTETEGVILGGTWLDRAYECLNQGEDAAAYAFLKMGSAVRHFLIDEFQDTSRRQWKILRVLADECLSNGGTLFYVGDVKQAIYGWRGGDWRLFREVVEQGFPAVDAASYRTETLGINYRSRPAIVEFNNRLYAGLADPAQGAALARSMMPRDLPDEKYADLAETLAANFQDVLQDLPPKLPAAEAPEGVRIQRFAGSAADLDLAIEASLRPQVREAWQRCNRGIAILVRSNRQAEAVATWLVAEGIPIVTENSLRLRSSPIIKGLVALLHFLEYPLDDMAFWGALASPLFRDVPGVPDADLEAFLRRGNWPRPLYRAFEKEFPEPARRLVRSLLARTGFLAPYDLVREMLAIFEVEGRFADDAVFVNRFLEIVFQAEAAGTMSLSSLLQFWDETGLEEQIGLPEDVPAVRIMTIHKAKGLEFPVVFVPFTNWKRDAEKLAVTAEGELVRLTAAAGVPLTARLQEIKVQTTIKNVIENVNLLYVATTRAKRELYLYVTCPLNRAGKPDTQYLATWLAEMLAGAGLDCPGDGSAEAARGDSEAEARPAPPPKRTPTKRSSK